MRKWRRIVGWIGLAGLLALGPVLAATLLPNGEQTFLDGNGDPLAAGKVYFYIPNTTTPKTTWRDAGQTTPNANPVALDSAGRAVIYGNGIYRQVVKDVFGNTIWDQLTTGYGTGAQVQATITGSTTITSCSGFFPVNNVSSADATITLPASPSDGDRCSFGDIAANAGTYNLIFNFNGHQDTAGQSTWAAVSNTQVISFLWLASPGKWVPN